MTPRVQKSTTRLLVAMKTTEPFQVSKTSMFERSSAVSSPREVTVRGAASTGREQLAAHKARKANSPAESTAGRNLWVGVMWRIRGGKNRNCLAFFQGPRIEHPR